MTFTHTPLRLTFLKVTCKRPRGISLTKALFKMTCLFQGWDMSERSSCQTWFSPRNLMLLPVFFFCKLCKPRFACKIVLSIFPQGESGICLEFLGRTSLLALNNWPTLKKLPPIPPIMLHFFSVTPCTLCKRF